MSAYPEAPIAVAMITRDEGARVGAVLASVANVTDRVVVCDTGSTDDTVDIARSSGASVVCVEWSDDFAAARNASLDHAVALWPDIEWILVVDADEVVAAVDADAVAGLQHVPESVDTLNISMVDRASGAGFRLPRLSRSACRYRGRIHEVPVAADGSPSSSMDFDGISLEHHGYLADELDLDAKAKRNLRIARAQFDDVGADQASPKVRYDLARSLMAAGEDLELAVALLGGLVSTGDEELPASWRVTVLVLLASALLVMGRAADALEAAAGALAIDADDDEARSLAARAASDAGEPHLLVELAAALESADHNSSATMSTRRSAAARLVWDLTLASAVTMLGVDELASKVRLGMIETVRRAPDLFDETVLASVLELASLDATESPARLDIGTLVGEFLRAGVGVDRIVDCAVVLGSRLVLVEVCLACVDAGVPTVRSTEVGAVAAILENDTATATILLASGDHLLTPDVSARLRDRISTR